MILIAYGIELKAKGFQIDDRFGDFDFDVHFSINEVTNWKTKETLISKNNGKSMEHFEVQIKTEIQPKENIVEGQVKENE